MTADDRADRAWASGANRRMTTIRSDPFPFLCRFAWVRETRAVFHANSYRSGYNVLQYSNNRKTAQFNLVASQFLRSSPDVHEKVNGVAI